MPQPPDGPEPADRDPGPSAGERRTDTPLWGTTPGQTISRVLLVIGALLLLWVVYVITRALG